MRTLSGTGFVEICGAADALAATVEDVSVDHRCSNIAVAKEFLHGTNVGTRLDQVRGKRMAECVCGDPLRDIAPFGCGANCLRNGRLVHVMTAMDTAAGIAADASCRVEKTVSTKTPPGSTGSG